MIISHMRQFLETFGFTPVAANSVDELSPEDIHEFSGAIISTISMMDVNDSIAGVFDNLRSKDPAIPIAFSSNFSVAMAKDAIHESLQSLVKEAVIVPLADITQDMNAFGQDNVFVLIRKDDLSDPDLRSIAGEVLKQHFRA